MIRDYKKRTDFETEDEYMEHKRLQRNAIRRRYYANKKINTHTNGNKSTQTDSENKQSQKNIREESDETNSESSEEEVIYIKRKKKKQPKQEPKQEREYYTHNTATTDPNRQTFQHNDPLRFGESRNRFNHFDDRGLFHFS